MSEQTNEEFPGSEPPADETPTPEPIADDAGAAGDPGPAGDPEGAGDGADEAGDDGAGQDGPSEEEAQAQYDNVVLPKSNILSGPSTADLNPAF